MQRTKFTKYSFSCFDFISLQQKLVAIYFCERTLVNNKDVSLTEGK